MSASALFSMSLRQRLLLLLKSGHAICTGAWRYPILLDYLLAVTFVTFQRVIPGLVTVDKQCITVEPGQAQGNSILCTRT